MSDSRRHRIRSSTRRRLTLTFGITLIMVALVGVLYPLYWNARSSTGAKRLISQQLSRINAAQSKNTTDPRAQVACQVQPGPGILEIPSLSLAAPVEQGLASSTLDIAVGHDPGTGWPGPGSTGLLAAHDVSFFSQINLLKPGDVVNYVVPCGGYFQNSGSESWCAGCCSSIRSETYWTGTAAIIRSCRPWPTSLDTVCDLIVTTAPLLSQLFTFRPLEG